MKKLMMVMTLIIAIPAMIVAMEEKPEMTQKDAEGLFWGNAFPAKDPETGEPRQFSYEEYKKNMITAISNGSTVQHHYHNPLYIAALNGDLEFAEFLLKHGAKKDFSWMSGMRIEDALRENYFRNKNPNTKILFEELFEKYKN